MSFGNSVRALRTEGIDTSPVDLPFSSVECIHSPHIIARLASYEALRWSDPAVSMPPVVWRASDGTAVPQRRATCEVPNDELEVDAGRISEGLPLIEPTNHLTSGGSSLE